MLNRYQSTCRLWPLLVTAGAIIFGASCSNDPKPRPPDSTATASPQQSATPEPSSPPVVSALTEVAPVLVKRVFAAGEAVTVKTGLGFLSAADGSLETWSPTNPVAGQYDPLYATPDSALLLYNEGKEGSPQHVIERATSRTWRLSKDAYPFDGTGHGTQLVVSNRTGDRSAVAILNVTDGSLRPVGLTGPGRVVSGIMSHDGSKVALKSVSLVSLIDLGTARAQDVVQGLDPGTDTIETLPGALGFAVTKRDGSQRRWFAWEGKEVPGGIGPGAISPNGKYIAEHWSPGGIKAVGMGGSPTIGGLVVFERAANLAVVQFLGADVIALSRADEAWVSSSDALVIEVADGYRLVTLSGQTITVIDDPIHVLAPRPSPSNAGLLGTNRGTIIDVSRNQTIAPNYAEVPWRARWSTGSSELVVELATPGKGRSWPLEILPFEVRNGAIHFPPAVVVNAGGACLNLRERPATTVPIVQCMPDGTRASIEQADDPAPDPKPSNEPTRKYAGFEDANLTVWLYLKLEAGQSGWVDSRFLGWAK